MTNFIDSSKLKDFADDNFKFDKNGRKIFEWWKTLWEKKKLLVTSKFLLFPQCFQRLVLQKRKNLGLFGKGLKSTTIFYLRENYLESSLAICDIACTCDKG